VRAGCEALGVPAAGLVEAAQVGEQAMHGGVEVDGLLGDLFAEGCEVVLG
jgi:hypothetical protein